MKSNVVTEAITNLKLSTKQGLLTVQDARDLCSYIEHVVIPSWKHTPTEKLSPNRLHVALTGGALYGGDTVPKDFDVVLYQWCLVEDDVYKVMDSLPGFVEHLARSIQSLLGLKTSWGMVGSSVGCLYVKDEDGDETLFAMDIIFGQSFGLSPNPGY